MNTELKTGRTTGSCSAAAAMAGVICLLTGDTPDEVAIPLPPGGLLDVPVKRYEVEGDAVRVTVIKDAGDDPDATHGCEIQAVVTIDHTYSGMLSVDIDGGTGVGRVTLPGLPVEVGKAAINPEPLRQIEMAAHKGAPVMETGRITILIEVPEGETIAKKTLNGRLGIKGGISILGTQGTVKPYSHSAWKATIEKGLDVARAQGLDHAVFTTGRRSERFYMERFPDTPELAMVQAADFFEFSMQEAEKRGFKRITWSIFFGKLVKQSQGLPYTHARTHPVDFDTLADRCAKAGVTPALLPAIREANTAIQVLGMLEDDPARSALIRLLVEKATKAATRFANGTITVTYKVFDFDGHELSE